MKLFITFCLIMLFALVINSQAPCKTFDCYIESAEKAITAKNYQKAYDYLILAHDYYPGTYGGKVQALFKQLLVTIEQDKKAATNPKNEGIIIKNKIQPLLSKMDADSLKAAAYYANFSDEAEAPPADPYASESDSMVQIRYFKGSASLVKTLEQKLAKNPTDTIIMKKLANAHGTLAWYQLFTRDYEGAVTSIQHSIKLSPKTTWSMANLACAYLLSGEWEKAEEIFIKWKDIPWETSGFEGINTFNTFQGAFLYNLNDLEENGITHPDFAKARKLLNEGKK